MMRTVGWSVASIAVLLSLAGSTVAQVEEGRARKIPWSGYWWPHKQGLMWTNPGPLTKYDQFVGTGKSAAWEAANHPRVGAQDWWGYCHAWSAASVTETEPTRSSAAGSVTLTVGDQKGLLTAAHAADPANVYGQRYNGASEDYSDLRPDVLWKYLKLYVKQQGLPLVLDVDAGPQVWNYPVYMYRVTYRNTGGDDYTGMMQLWFADDAVAPNYVGIKAMTRTYQFSFKMRGGSVLAGSGAWIGTSVKDHPDFAWYPSKAQPENPHVDYQTVLKMIGRSGGGPGPLPPAPPPVPIPDPHNPPPPTPPGPNNPPVPNPDPPPAPLPNEPVTQPQVVLSPTEFMTMIAFKKNKASNFFFDVKVSGFAKDSGFNPILAAGDRFFVQAAAKKAGYVYLFHVEPNGDFSLVYPLPGQNNMHPAEKSFTIGGPNDPAGAAFTAEGAVGTHRILAFITTRPLRLTNGIQVQKEGGGKKVEFYLNPTTKDTVRGLVIEYVGGKTSPEKVQKDTGVDVQQFPFEYAMAEAIYRVEGAGVKPKPDQK